MDDLKVLDHFIGPTVNVTTTATMALFPNPAVGTGGSQRTGDTYTNHKLKIIMNLYGNSTDVVNTVRLVFFQLKVAPSAISVGNFFDTGPSTAVDIHSQISFQYRTRFHILYDALIPLNWNGNSGNIAKMFEVSLPIKDIRCDYGTTTSSSGQFGWIYFSDSGLTPYPLLTISTRQLFFG